MKVAAPIVDLRQAAEVLSALDARAPGYTPEWSRTAGRPDDALAQIFARYTAIFLDGLRQMPDRGLLAFLDMTGTRLLPAKAARAPVVFELMENATTDPLLPVNSEVAAPAEPKPPSALLESETPPSTSETTVFATEKMVTLARARLVALYSLHPGSDEFADHGAQLTSGFTLFDEMQPLEHALYLGHDELFALSSSAEFTAHVALSIEFAPGGAAPQPLEVNWEYLSADGWLPLDLEKGSEKKRSDDGTDGFTHDGQIMLFKSCGPDAKEDTIAGHKSYWIRGVLQTSLAPRDALALAPVLETIRARVSFVKAGLLAEAAATGAFAVDLATTFFPFGQQPVRFTTFYLASKEVFQRRGARVQIHFQLPANLKAAGSAELQLDWEYFDGKIWRSIKGFEFSDATANLTKSEAIAFVAPPDWGETTVAGQKNLWLRARIEDGDYGKPLQLEVTGETLAETKVKATPNTVQPPIIAALTLQYNYQTDSEPLDHCLSFNDFVYADHTHACLWPREVFEPFRPLEERLPAMHFGFDKPLPRGLVSLFVHLPAGAADEAASNERPAFVWEYRGEHGWDELGVLDETGGFRRSGMIQFIGPKDAIATPGLGGALFRIRARLKSGERLAQAPIAGIWMNAVWATHRYLVKKEELGMSDGNPKQTFHFRPRTPAPAPPPGGNAPERPVIFRQGTPVLEGEVLEVREWAGRGLDYETAIQGVPAEEIRYERDRVSGAVTEVWVRWHEQPHLFESAPTARDYVIERALGSVRFGDDVHGRIPLAGSRIVVTYGTGGGLSGNVPAGAISELRSGVPFLKSFSNPVAALGGAEAETLDSVQPRGAQRLRHGDRAISALDIEWLARDASPAVARARCLPVTGPIGRVQRGWITVAILPHSADAQPVPTAELERYVHQHLVARVPAAMAGRVRIVAPTYVPVGVVAEVVPRLPGEAARVEARVLRRLMDFLHPLTGRLDGSGWTFGQPLYLSQIASLLEQTDGVDYVTEIALRVGAELFGDPVPVAPDALIASGDHELALILRER